MFQLKQFLKTCSITNYKKKLRQLLEKIEENAKFIERERNKVTFALKDDKMVAAWEANIKSKGTPLITFYENWNKLNKIQKRKKITKNDEIAGALPMIKRSKISEEEVFKAKPVNKGPMVLFPSDSEDEKDHFKVENDKDTPSKVKKLKKKVHKNKNTVKNVEIDEDTNVNDKDDIVQDFSVTDW